MGLSTTTTINCGGDEGGTEPHPPPPHHHVQSQQQQQQGLKCPRCDSSHTKFCYYNNYNKSQPRHFCKGCKRHWTHGGTLRNVPVGGARKNKRLKSPATSSASNKKPVFQPGHENGPTHPVITGCVGSFSFPGYFDPMTSCSSFNNNENGGSYGDVIVGEIEEPSSYDDVTMPSLFFNQGVMSIGGADVANCWSLSDFDSLVSADLNIPWDDLEIKPTAK